MRSAVPKFDALIDESAVDCARFLARGPSMNVEGREILRQVRAGDFVGQFGDHARRASEFAIPLGAATAYYLGCLVGFALRFPSSGISFFWPPNAILTTALLVVAPRRWPVLLATTFFAHAIAHG